MAIRSLSSRVTAEKRQIMVRTLSGVLPLFIVNEYPKCGGSWFGEMLGDALGVPFPRNQAPPLRSCIMHGHYLNQKGLRNVIVIWRDGRDVMTSYYYHCYFKNDRNNGPLVGLMRRELPFDDYEDVQANLPTFIERMLTRPIWPRFTWQKFVSRWYHHQGAIHVRYEDLLKSAAGELSRVIAELGRKTPPMERLSEIVEMHAFKRKAGRVPGAESKTSFLRKGVAGDWENYFKQEACEIFDHYAGEQLVALGYEPDRSWVNRER
ncbi:MAG: sulfotransferase domain-containing protein [Candidatus Micrarchaeaceae archaeon]